MVCDLPYLGTRWKDMSEVAFPLRRVWPVPVATSGRGIEHCFDAAAHPACRFRFLCPNRIKHLHDKPSIDRRHRQFPQDGIDVGFERVYPLLPMLGVAPAGPVLFDEIGGALAEGPALR